MRQLLLDLLPANPPSLDNFVTGGNSEAIDGLTRWLAEDSRQFSVCLWGEPGAGKSHLLQASGFVLIDAALNPDLTAAPESGELAVDHVDQLSPAGQIALFNCFNRLKAAGGRLLTAAPQAPHHLDLREDLRTRLGSGLIFRLLPLSDAEKMAALTTQTKDRAMKMPAGGIDYLFRHAPRDMRSLSALIIALDAYTLEHKRALTLPLLREVLQSTREN